MVCVALRTVLIRDDRDAIAAELLRYGDANGNGWASVMRDCERMGLREARAAWLTGVSLREYRELEAGAGFPDFDTWNRICKLYGWPQTFVPGDG